MCEEGEGEGKKGGGVALLKLNTFVYHLGGKLKIVLVAETAVSSLFSFLNATDEYVFLWKEYN